MGCGSSKGTVSVSKSQPYATNNSSLPPYNGISTTSHHKTNLSSKMYSDGSELPPPRPPDQTVEELLKDKKDLMKIMDQHATQVSFDKAVKQGLNEFTDETLIPKDTITEHETLDVVENNNQSSQLETDAIIATTSIEDDQSDDVIMQPPESTFDPTSLGNEKDNADAAELLLEKYKRDTEKAKNLMMVDKMRHNITLQDKLAKRKEMKRRAQEAAAVSHKGELSNEGARVQRQLSGEMGDKKMIENTDFNQQQTINQPLDSLVNVANNTEDGEVEAAQDKYDAVMAEAAPMPTAPETRKEAIYGDEDNIELFKDLEDFAINMEQISSPATTFAILMNSLLINQLSDLEKVRILFHWITKQDLNTINFPDNIDEDTPMGFLFAIKHGRKTYAELFSRLCSAAGLHAKVITGYLKGVGYLPDYKFTGAGDPFRGSWNAVLINGQWRLIDTHWGARHVLEDDDVPSAEHETIYRYEEHYFLTNPDQLIVTHFPDEVEWQLLSNPITLEQFQETVKIWPLHYKLKLQLYSHLHGVVQAPQDGVVEIRVKTSDFARRDAEFKCDFMTKQKLRSVGKFKLACFTFHYTEKEFQVFQVHCPAVGEYILKIFGMSKKFSDEEVFTNIALYQINCPKLKSKGKHTPKDPTNVLPSEISAPFPEVNMPWGPPTGPRALAVSPMSHGGPIITCDKNGEATLVMQILRGENLCFLQQLYEADGRVDTTKQALQDNAVHLTTMTRSQHRAVVFCIRTPHSGNFSLNLYLNTESEGNFTGFCNYLVVSPSQSKQAVPFPIVPNGDLGPNAKICRDLGIFPRAFNKYVTHNAGKFLSDFGESWIQTNEENMALITFTHSEPMVFLADLSGTGRCAGADLSRNILIEDTGKKVRIIIHPPKFDHDSPECALKVFAAPATQKTGIPVVYTAFVQNASKEPKLLPQSPTKRWGPGTNNLDAEFSVVSILNSEPSWTVDCEDDGKDPTPCQMYKGGKDIVFQFALKRPLILKPVFSIIQQNGSFTEVGDGFSLISKMDHLSVTLSIRIPKAGDYCLSLFGGDSSGQSVQLLPLYYSLLSATASSECTSQFPRSFPIWNSSISHLHSPSSKDLQRNNVNKISVSISERLDTTSRPYTKVMLLTDKSQAVSPSRTDANINLYEWEYVPGPGEKIVSLVVQKTAQDSSLTYALQFDVI
ncbi:uncharacterized protein LOC120334225 [Styela clava]